MRKGPTTYFKNGQKKINNNSQTTENVFKYNNSKAKIKRFDNILHGQKRVGKAHSYIFSGGVTSL